MTQPETAAAARQWTLTELRQGIWLGYGAGDTHAHPGVAAFAAAVGVSARTVRRWLAGSNAPSPARVATIRAALSPPADVLARQRMDRRHAEAAVKELARSRPRAASKQWRAQGWHLPHCVWLMHHEVLQIRRVMVARAQPARSTVFPDGWVIHAQLTLPTRPAAVLVKHDILDQVAPWRVRVRADLVEDGRHESWLDTAPPVVLPVQ